MTEFIHNNMFIYLKSSSINIRYDLKIKVKYCIIIFFNFDFLEIVILKVNIIYHILKNKSHCPMNEMLPLYIEYMFAINM